MLYKIVGTKYFHPVDVVKTNPNGTGPDSVICQWKNKIYCFCLQSELIDLDPDQLAEVFKDLFRMK